jgi:hypothetical protein
MNAIMGMYVGSNNPFFFGEKGWALTESLGIGRMMHWTVEGQTPLFMFLMDEPDACDASTEQVDPPTERLGTSGQWLVKWAAVLRPRAPDSPGLLNIDGTFKPENYYMYHQLPDIPCIDPYYQGELDQVFTRHPGNMAAYSKPTYVFATTTLSQSAGQPKPLHVILCSTRYRDDEEGYSGRYPTPEEKRMEVYYAIAAGAKGLSYWWYTPDAGCHGCGADEPAAKALWHEIGLLGAEVRTAGPVITKSCPASLDIQASRNLWVRSLISGLDTVAIITVNDDVFSDRHGTVYEPVERAKVTFGLPSWLKPKDAFEVTYDGIKDVSWGRDGSKVKLDLGVVNLSRFVVVTSNPSLRAELQKLYADKSAANVAALKGS